MRNLGLFESIEDFNQMILATRDGRPIRLEDVGFAQDGVADERGLGRFNLQPSLGIGVAPRSGANLVDVNGAAIERMKELAEDFPEGMSWAIAFDGAEFVEQSIRNVQVDIFYGAVLAIIVVFVFLRSWRSHLHCLVGDSNLAHRHLRVHGSVRLFAQQHDDAGAGAVGWSGDR